MVCHPGIGSAAALLDAWAVPIAAFATDGFVPCCPGECILSTLVVKMPDEQNLQVVAAWAAGRGRAPSVSWMTW